MPLGYQLNVKGLSLHEPLKHFWVSREIFIDTLTMFVLGEVGNKAPSGNPWWEFHAGIYEGPKLVS